MSIPRCKFKTFFILSAGTTRQEIWRLKKCLRINISYWHCKWYEVLQKLSDWKELSFQISKILKIELYKKLWKMIFGIKAWYSIHDNRSIKVSALLQISTQNYKFSIFQLSKLSWDTLCQRSRQGNNRTNIPVSPERDFTCICMVANLYRWQKIHNY